MIETLSPLERCREELGEPDALFSVSPKRFWAKFGLGVLLLAYGVAANIVAWDLEEIICKQTISPHFDQIWPDQEDIGKFWKIMENIRKLQKILENIRNWKSLSLWKKIRVCEK